MEREQREDAEGQVVERQDGDIGATHRTAVILLFVLVAIAPVVTARWGFVAFVAAYVAALSAWGALRDAAPSLRVTIIVAVLLRIPLFFSAPLLSGDVYRYLWDGTVTRAGINPYAHAPDAAVLAPLRTSWHDRINHPTIRTIYPPVAQLLFAATPALLTWRLLLLAVELAALAVIGRRSLHAAFACATFPLLLFEGTWSAHLDVVAGAALTVALLTTRPWLLAVAGALKVIPLAAVPSVILRSKHRVRTAVTILAIVVLPLLPFLATGPLMPGLKDYAARWEFNSPAYSAAQALAVALPLKETWTSIKDALHLESVAPFVYAHVHPEFVARVILGAIFVAVCWWRRASPLDGVGALLLLSPTIHPWYWLVLAPFAVVKRSWWLAFAATAPFSYLLYAGASPWLVMLLCYGIPVAWIIARLRTSTPAP